MEAALEGQVLIHIQVFVEGAGGKGNRPPIGSGID
jgi:hypothetical protein